MVDPHGTYQQLPPPGDTIELGGSSKRAPTARQLAVLAAIAAQQACRGFPPTHREICSLFGYNSPHASVDHCEALERKGLLVIWNAHRSRTLRVTPAGHAALAARRWQFIPIPTGKAGG